MKIGHLSTIYELTKEEVDVLLYDIPKETIPYDGNFVVEPDRIKKLLRKIIELESGTDI